MKRLIRSSCVLLALPFVTSLMGMTCGPGPGGDPCEQDRLGCDDTPSGDWQLIDCPGVDGDLDVELGQGDREFEPVGPGSTPHVHYGLQGGQHTFLGVRVMNARLDLDDTLRITFWLGQGPDCAAPATPMAAPPESCATLLGRRQVVLGGPLPLTVRDDGVVEEAGMLVYLEPLMSAPTVVGVQVEDRCGRVGGESFGYLGP